MDKLPNNLCFKKFYRSVKKLLININMDLMKIAEYMDHEDNFTLVDELHYYILALEDRYFFKHCGVDFSACIRETLKAIFRKKHGGASTIDMQLVRTLTDYRDMTLSRKIYEMTLAILINFRYTKKQILNCYMREAYLGSGIKGFSAAAKKRFPNKINTFLTNDHLACLAAMLLKPMPLNPTSKWYADNTSRARYAQATRIFVKECKY